MPIKWRKWWIERANEVVERQNNQRSEVARMPAPQNADPRSNPMRARNVGN
jgi:hypothetical protein